MNFKLNIPAVARRISHGARQFQRPLINVHLLSFVRLHSHTRRGTREMEVIARPGVPYDSITSPLLRSAKFGKLDKIHFVKSFVESQKHHATSYAADGKGIFAALDGQTPKKERLSAGQLLDFGFGTPVLKPRVTKQRFESKRKISDSDVNDNTERDKKLRATKSSRLESKSKTNLKAVVEPTSKVQKENVRHPSTTPAVKKISKKRSIQVDSDDERAAREPGYSFHDAHNLICAF